MLLHTYNSNAPLYFQHTWYVKPVDTITLNFQTYLWKLTGSQNLMYQSNPTNLRRASLGKSSWFYQQWLSNLSYYWVVRYDILCICLDWHHPHKVQTLPSIRRHNVPGLSRKHIWYGRRMAVATLNKKALHNGIEWLWLKPLWLLWNVYSYTWFRDLKFKNCAFCGIKCHHSGNYWLALTHRGLKVPYGIGKLGQHWFR